jgi:hypothetical protein
MKTCEPSAVIVSHPECREDLRAVRIGDRTWSGNRGCEPP